MEFHAEGDASGNYMLSGLWELTTRRTQDDAVPTSPQWAAQQQRAHRATSGAATRRDPYLCWSGNGFASPARPAVPEVSTTLLTLKSRGVFESPPAENSNDEADRWRGAWSCDGDEVTLARYGRYGRQVVEWYTGTVKAEEVELNRLSGSVSGHIGYGAHEPEYAGTFTMRQVLPQFNPLRRREETRGEGVVFTTDRVAGTYSLQLAGSSSSPSIFLVELKPDLTWETVGGIGATTDAQSSTDDDGPRLAGKWNVYRDSIDLSSGIPGEGARLWLWLRRFGTRGGRVSKGVSGLNADQLFMGRIRPVPAAAPSRRADPRPGYDLVFNPDEALMTTTGAWGDLPFEGEEPLDDRPVRDIRGHIAVGWSIEPAFIGRFTMRPWGGDDDDDTA